MWKRLVLRQVQTVLLVIRQVKRLIFLEEIVMYKDKVITGALIVALCGCAVKMVKTLRDHGAVDEK